DPIIADEFVGGVKRHVPLGQPRMGRRDTRQGILAEGLVLLRNGRIERQILGGDDLIGVDVIGEDVGLAGDGGLHGVNRLLDVQACLPICSRTHSRNDLSRAVSSSSSTSTRKRVRSAAVRKGNQRLCSTRAYCPSACR